MLNGSLENQFSIKTNIDWIHLLNDSPFYFVLSLIYLVAKRLCFYIIFWRIFFNKKFILIYLKPKNDNKKGEIIELIPF